MKKNVIIDDMHISYVIKAVGLRVFTGFATIAQWFYLVQNLSNEIEHD